MKKEGKYKFFAKNQYENYFFAFSITALFYFKIFLSFLFVNDYMELFKISSHTQNIVKKNGKNAKIRVYIIIFIEVKI